MDDENNQHIKLAEVFCEAVEKGGPPAKAVEKHFNLSPSTAGRRIAQARELGYLAKGHGQRERRNSKALAVAKALGVTYDDLIAAVREHAGGDLRVVMGEEVPCASQ